MGRVCVLALAPSAGRPRRRRHSSEIEYHAAEAVCNVSQHIHIYIYIATYYPALEGLFCKISSRMRVCVKGKRLVKTIIKPGFRIKWLKQIPNFFD